MRFGRLPKEEAISSKQLQQENKLLEERLAAIKKFTEDERKKSEMRALNMGSSSKGFNIRELKRINLRPTEREQVDQNKEIVFYQHGFGKKGIRAYEEVVKNRKIQKDGHPAPKEKPNEELISFLESLNMVKFLSDFQKQGIITVEQLKNADISKLGLLPGFEIKLSKKIGDLKSLDQTSKVRSTAQISEAKPSDDEDDFLTKKSVPIEKPRRYRAILSKHKSLHEDSTMSDVKAKLNDSTSHKAKQEDFACGAPDADNKGPKLSCWNCLKLINNEEKVARHPILDGKVV